MSSIISTTHITQREHVLITGAGQRLGFHAAHSLLQDGHQVTITYRRRQASVDKLIALGATCIQADFSTDAGIQKSIAYIQNQVEDLTAIVHNASTWSSDNPEQLEGVFDDMMQVHAKAPYLINYALQARYANLSNIIHISDFVSDVGSTKHIAYAASKAAMDNLTLSFARKWAPNVRVNSIAPSLIIFNEDDGDAYRQKALSKSLLEIEPGEKVVTDTIKYLLSNHYLTGQIIALNGGRHLKLP